MRIPALVLFACTLLGSSARAGDWRFAVSGDSRNCGDVVMPEIAKGAEKAKAEFYWHLGDYRAIYRVDQDYAQSHSVANPESKEALAEYQDDAWADFTQAQLKPFGKRPVMLALGNHELIQPKTRIVLLTQFAKWFNSSDIRKQREQDDKHDTAVKTYYHVIKKDIDFITLDNASADQFDDAQLTWLKGVLDRDEHSSSIRAIVLGMHEALPESIAKGHSMSDSKVGEETGIKVYHWLLDLKQRSQKPVYVLASHSHYYMAGVYQSDYWRRNGGVLPGWIIGTAGAERYLLPQDWKLANEAKEHVYGYVIGKVTDDKSDPIQFEFHELQESDVSPKVTEQYSAGFVHECWVGNPGPNVPKTTSSSPAKP